MVSENFRKIIKDEAKSSSKTFCNVFYNKQGIVSLDIRLFDELPKGIIDKYGTRHINIAL